MSSTDIYNLINSYKLEVATETDASLRSCELLYQFKCELLKQCDNNTQSSSYKKHMKSFRKETGISQSQFSKDSAVGEKLTQLRVTGSNEISCLSKRQIWLKYCTTPKTKIISPPKPTYKELEAENSKLKEQLAELQARREKDHEEFERHAKKIMARISA